MKTAIVSSAHIGTGCWTATQFVGGVCSYVEHCKHPEKKHCKAFRIKRVYSTKKILAKDCT